MNYGMRKTKWALHAIVHQFILSIIVNVNRRWLNARTRISSDSVICILCIS